MRFISISLALALTTGAAHAADAGPSSSSGMFTVLLGLILVLGLVAACAWVLKRMGPMRVSGGAHVKIVGGTAIGARERIMVVEVADQWLVLGVTSTQINTLATLPRQELPATSEGQGASHPFAAWLKQTLDKRNEKQK